MCIAQILEENNAFKAEIAMLRQESPFYPAFLRKYKENNELVISSNIRKEKDGVWYSILLVERVILDGTITEGMIFQRFMQQAYNVILFYKISGEHEDVCKIQISEEERLNPKK